MRAISLDGSLTTRLRKDETRYTLHEAAEKLHEMGYDIGRSESGRLPYWPHPNDVPQPVAAELQTACGCTKRMFIERFTRTIRVPMHRELSVARLVSDPAAAIAVSIRQFEYRRMETRDGLPVAIFVETT